MVSPSVSSSLRISCLSWRSQVGHNSQSLASAIEFTMQNLSPDSIREVYQPCTLTALAASRGSVIYRFYKRKLVRMQQSNISWDMLSNPGLIARVSERRRDLNKFKPNKHPGFLSALKAGPDH